MQIGESAPNEKSVLWQEKLKSLEEIVDRLGRYIDNEIKETLVAFELNNIPTDSSCGGHLEAAHMRFPYVSGESKGRPRYAYAGQEDIEHDIEKKYAITSSEIRTHEEAKKEYRERLNDQEPSEAYKEWQAKDYALPVSVGELLGEFYQTRNSPEDVRLFLVERIATGYYMVTKNYIQPKEISAKGEYTQEELDAMRTRIIAAREEFQAFADFLKQKFLSV